MYDEKAVDLHLFQVKYTNNCMKRVDNCDIATNYYKLLLLKIAGVAQHCSSTAIF